MIIEYELQGSKCLHKGIFDTNGFWVRHESEYEVVARLGDEPIIEGWKIYSHSSFSFYHIDKIVVDEVYKRLSSVIKGAINVDINGVGYIRKLNK